MADALAKLLIADYKREKGKRGNWENLWDDVTSVVLPRKRNIWESKVSGQRRNHNVYDASAIHFNELLASALHSMLTNPSVNWFELRARNPEIQDLADVKKFLQKFTDRMHQFINNSNFHSEVHELYLDLGCLGQSVFRIMPDPDDVFRFKSRPIYSYWIKENSKNLVDTIYTTDDLTFRQFVQMYGEKSFPETERINAQKKPDKLYKVLHVVMPSKELRNNPTLDYKSRKPFASIHILLDFEHTVKKSSFTTFPYMTPRWNKLSDEVYGRSPGMKALPDIKMLNAMKRDTIRAAQKATDPPTLMPDDSTYGPPNIEPGGLIYYRAGSKDEPHPLKIGSNPGVGLQMVEFVREQIRQAFFVDQLQLKDGPQMTATEVNVRENDSLRLLGPVLGRLHNEFLQPMVARLVDIMIKTDNVPEGMPEALADQDFEVLFTSQIAKAQMLAEGQKISRLMGQVGPMVEVAPQILDNFDFDFMAKYLVDIGGVPQGALKDEQVRDEQRVAQQEAAQKQQQQQEALTGAEVVNKVS